MLFDEDLDYRLARSFPTSFDVYSAQWTGWSGMSNGDLLRTAAAEGFDVLVTADRNMRHQQPQPSMPVLVLEVGSTALRDLSECIPQIAKVLAGPLVPGYYVVGQREHGWDFGRYSAVLPPADPGNVPQSSSREPAGTAIRHKTAPLTRLLDMEQSGRHGPVMRSALECAMAMPRERTPLFRQLWNVPSTAGRNEIGQGCSGINALCILVTDRRR